MKIFFITGVQRSGTTLLSVMLEKHPEIYLDGFSVAFRLVTCVKNYQMVLPYNLEHPKEEILSWLIQNDYKGRLAELIDCQEISENSNVRSLLQKSIQNQLKQKQKTVWADKAPNLQHFVSDVLTMLPEAKFVHIVRDGRATAYSLSQRAYKNIYLSAQEWVDGNIVGLVNQDLIGKENFHIIHYEDLISEPKETIKSVCKFLEIPFYTNMLNLDQGLSSEEEKKQYVKSTLDSSKIDQYKTKLSVKVIKEIERIQGPLLQKLGYDLIHEHSPNNFRQLSAGKSIWLNLKDNFINLFRRKRKGMHNRKNIERKTPFKKRLYYLLFKLSRDILSERLHKTIFRRSFVKDKYLRK